MMYDDDEEMPEDGCVYCAHSFNSHVEPEKEEDVPCKECPDGVCIYGF